MQNKLFLAFLASIIFSFFGFNSELENKKNYKNNCINCDSITWIEAENYLQRLKKGNIKKVIKISRNLDSLSNVVEFKDGIILNQKNKIKSLKKDLLVKPKEVIRVDTFLVQKKKNFWGKIKTDTIH